MGTERESKFLGVYALESPNRPPPSPSKGKEKEVVPEPSSPTLNLNNTQTITGSERKRLKLTLKGAQDTGNGSRKVGSVSCHHCRNIRNRIGSVVHFTIGCEECGICWHADCIRKRYDYETVPMSIATVLPTCPACLQICTCQRCDNQIAPRLPRISTSASRPRTNVLKRRLKMKGLKTGQFGFGNQQSLELVQVEQVEVREFESAGMLEMRIREERKRGRQKHWERVLSISPNQSGDEDDYSPSSRKREDSYSSVDESEESDSEYEEEGERFWLSSTESVESMASSTGFVTWSGGKGRENGKLLNRGMGGGSPTSSTKSTFSTIPPDEIALSIQEPPSTSPTPTFSIPSLELPSSPTTTRTTNLIELLDSFTDEQLGSAIRTLLLAGPSSFGLSLFGSTNMKMEDERSGTVGMKRRRDGHFTTTLAPAFESSGSVDGGARLGPDGLDTLTREESLEGVGKEMKDRLTPILTESGSTEDASERTGDRVMYDSNDWTEDWL